MQHSSYAYECDVQTKEGGGWQETDINKPATAVTDQNADNARGKYSKPPSAWRS